MNRPHHSAARGAAATLALAGMGMAAAAAEPLRVSGVFGAMLWRAKPEHEREYLQVHEHVQDLRRRAAARQRMLGSLALVGRSAARMATRGLLSQADEAAEYLRTLQEPQVVLSAPNVVTDVGARYLLDNGLAGSAYTAAFFLGLISSTSYSAVAAGDTMASHAGWLEAGAANAPTYSEATRRTAAWSAASSRSKALSAGLVFTFTGSGTVKGCFLSTVNTKDGTTGTLYSAGTFTGGDQPVVNTNTLTVSYTASL